MFLATYKQFECVFKKIKNRNLTFELKKNCARIGSVGCADTASHSLALKLRKACFRLLIVEPVTPKADDVSNQTCATKLILKRTTRVRLNIGWGARIRTMIKRTKISCPTIRRHPNCVYDYKYILLFCNNKIIVFLI